MLVGAKGKMEREREREREREGGVFFLYVVNVNPGDTGRKLTLHVAIITYSGRGSLVSC